MIEPSLGCLVAIDPSINSCGVAIFKAGALWRVNTIECAKTKDIADRCYRMSQNVVRWIGECKVRPRTIAIEWPQVYAVGKSKGDNNKLLGLSGVAIGVATLLGGVLASTGDECLQVVSYKPAEWAGQLPKTKTKNPSASPRARRIHTRLTEEEALEWVDDHDAIDAVGIGLHALGRMSPRRVYAGATTH